MMGYILSTSHCLSKEVNDVENNPGPAVFNNTNPTTTVSAGHKSRNWQKHTLVNIGKQCVANYVYLIIVLIYNNKEDTVLIICILDRAHTVLQDINSAQEMCISH